jgi:glycosyltransferase involved in cell wall biosynthesis
MKSENIFDDFSLSIALVNYKTPEVTKICLELLQKAIDVNKITVWVVDNDSKDESLAYLKSLNWINLIERKPVLNEHGFMAHGRALDLILEQVSTDYLLLMHTDTLIYDASIIKNMLEQLSKNKKAAAIGCLEQVYRTPIATIWRLATRAVKYYFRKFKLAFGLRTREPRLFYEIYLKSFCTLWNVNIVKKHEMHFAMVERIPGYEMQDHLRKLGYEFLSISPQQMFQYLDHIEAGTVSHVKGLAKNHKRVKNYQAIMNRVNKS